MPPETPESFVDAAVAADFLQLSPRHLLDLARAGHLPGYPLGSGKRRIWRFRLSEIANALQANAERDVLVYGDSDPSYASKPPKRVARRLVRRATVSEGLSKDRAA